MGGWMGRWVEEGKRTYIGGAMSLMSTSLEHGVSRPACKAALMASMPSYAKQVTSMSARILMGFGARRLVLGWEWVGGWVGGFMYVQRSNAMRWKGVT